MKLNYGFSYKYYLNKLNENFFLNCIYIYIPGKYLIKILKKVILFYYYILTYYNLQHIQSRK